MPLRNPMTGGTHWYHGSPADFESFRGARSAHDYDESKPWNTTLGDHFTAHHETAQEFAQGLHPQGFNPDEEPSGPENGHVYHAHLHVKKPVYFDNESDFEHHVNRVLGEHAAGGGDPHAHSRDVYLDWMQRNGHDSVVYGNECEGPYRHPSIIVPHKKHIEVVGKHSAWDDSDEHEHKPTGSWASRTAARDQSTCPHDGGWNLHGQCKKCGYIPPTEGDEPCDNPWCVAHEPEHTKAEHIDPPHLDPGHPDYHSAEQSIEDAIGTHPDAWLLDHQSEGPSKYSARWHNVVHVQPGESEQLHKNLPDKRLFAPTKTELDPVLFDGDHLKPTVRQGIIDLYANFWDHTHPSWRRWTKIFFTGSQASYWWGNHDFDTLIGVKYEVARQVDPKLAGLGDTEIDDILNAELRHGFNNEDWIAPWSTSKADYWHLTGYVNTASWDIARLKPYAAYDVIADSWIVHPDQVPENWSVKSFGEGFVQRAERIIGQIKRIETQPNQRLRAMEGQALWDYIHGDRSRAFSEHGTGWKDWGNALEKYLDQTGWLSRLLQLKHAGNVEFGASNLLDRKDSYDVAPGNSLGTTASRGAPCPACSGSGEQGTGHECYACDGTGLASAYDPNIDNANPENGLLVGRDDARGIKPVEAAAHPYAQQDWYHGGVLGHEGHNLYDDKTRNSGINWLHIGTKKAALDRIDPEGYSGGSYEWPLHQHKRLYRVRLAPGARVCPTTHTGDMETLDADDPGSDSFAPSCRHPDGGEYDAHPYVNEHEDKGNISLAVKSHKVRVVEDLGRHPRWSEPGYGAKWQGHEAAVKMLDNAIGDDDAPPTGIMVHLVPPLKHIEPLMPEDGEHPDNIHMTLAYLGKSDDHTEEQLRNLPEVIQSWAEGQQPMDGHVVGIGTFVNSDNPNENERHVLWANADIPGLPQAYVSLHEHLRQHGYKPYSNHGFTPHVTLGYSKHHFRFLPKLEEKKPWPVREVWLAIGPRWESFPLGVQ